MSDILLENLSDSFMVFGCINVKPVHTEHLLIFLIEIQNQNQYSIVIDFFFELVYNIIMP